MARAGKLLENDKISSQKNKFKPQTQRFTYPELKYSEFEARYLHLRGCELKAFKHIQEALKSIALVMPNGSNMKQFQRWERSQTLQRKLAKELHNLTGYKSTVNPLELPVMLA